MNKVGVFFLLVILALVTAISAYAQASLSITFPVTPLCNYSVSRSPSALAVGDYNALASLLRLGDSSCILQVSVSGLKDSTKLGQAYEKHVDVTPLVGAERWNCNGALYPIGQCVQETVCSSTDSDTGLCSSEITQWNCAGVSRYPESYCHKETPSSGVTNQEDVVLDPDKFWDYFSGNSGTFFREQSITKVQFIEDPFVLLNSVAPFGPYWTFHDGYGDASLHCSATVLSKGEVSSPSECIEYSLSPKFLSCNGEINGNPCCGDDDLINPGFEATEAEPNLDVWQINCKGGHCYRDGSEKHSGGYSLLMRQCDQAGTVSQTATLPGGAYRISFWAKSSNVVPTQVGSFAAYLLGGSSGPALISSSVIYIPANTGDWHHYSSTFQIIGEQTINFQFYIGTDASSTPTGTIYIDDVHLLSTPWPIGTFLTDYGTVSRTIGTEQKPYLCYHNQSIWQWMDPDQEQFKIIHVNGFDMISNSLLWHACNANGVAATIENNPADVELTPNYGIVTWNQSIISSTIIELGQYTPGQYGFSDEDTRFIDQNDFEPGLVYPLEQPTGAPAHCYNNITDGGETDKDCGDGCAKCADGKHCNSSEDCIFGYCDPEDKICSGSIPDINAKEKIAQRFICSQMDEISAYTECCGYSLTSCKNTNLRSNIRRAGNPLYDIFDFPIALDNKNYVIALGLLDSQTEDYNYPFVMANADNKLYDWTGYSYLEFYIDFALPPVTRNGAPYFKLLVLDEAPESPFTRTYPHLYYEPNNPGYEEHVLFRGDLRNFITGQIQNGKWLKVRIPIGTSPDKTQAIQPSQHVKLVSLFAYNGDVPEYQVFHEKFKQGDSYIQFRNIIAIDRLNLIPAGHAQMYCSNLPPKPGSSIKSYWTDNMNTKEEDLGNNKIGQGICENTPGFAWTGNACCGDDVYASSAGFLPLNPVFVSESYADSLSGCVKGFPLKNNTAMTLVYNNGYGIGNASLEFYNGKFFTCNKNVQSLIDPIVVELWNGGNDGVLPVHVYQSFQNINTQDNSSPECFNLGSWYCDFDFAWKNTSALPNQMINSSVNLSNLNPANPPKACCPSGWCYFGNNTAPYSCVPSQSSYFQYTEANGTPYLFNASQLYAGIYGDNNSYRCIAGNWMPAEIKWNPNYPENGDRGYCPKKSQCYLNASMCVDSGYFSADDYCENGSWSSRTKLVAKQLLRMAAKAINQSGWESSVETIYCDKFNESLAQVDYIDIALSNLKISEIITGGAGGCPGLSGKPCANNFCALSIKNDLGEKIFIGTSMNLPVNTPENANVSILELFSEAQSSAVSYNNFCDGALRQSNITNDYVGCKANYANATPGHTANIWIDNATQTLIYSKEEFDINNTLASSEIFNLFLKHPLQAIYYWARTRFIGAESPLEDSEGFLTNTSKFRKLYISVSPDTSDSSKNKEIRGVVEPPNLMAIGYKNVEENLCYGNKTSQKLGIGSYDVAASCNFRINETEFWQNLYTAAITELILWKDLTSNTRLEGTYTPQLLASTVKVSGPALALVGAENPLAYTINVSPAAGETIIATSIDFGDGTSYSIRGVPPEGGIMNLNHIFVNSALNSTITAGIIGDNYRIRSDSMVVSLGRPISLLYRTNESTSGKLTNFTLNLSGYGPYNPNLTFNDSWLNCSPVDSNMLVCFPWLNQHGTGNANITISSGSENMTFPLSITVNPVNTPPAFGAMPESLAFPEDSTPVILLDVSDYVADIETGNGSLLYYMTGLHAPDETLRIELGCDVMNRTSGLETKKSLECVGNKTDYFGMFRLNLTVTDLGDGASAPKGSSRIINVTVTPVNDPPSLSILNVTMNTHQVYGNIAYGTLIHDIDTAPSNFTLICIFVSGTASPEPNVTANNITKILKIESYGAEGEFFYNCTASDGELTSQSNFKVNVTANKIAPALYVAGFAENFTVNEGDIMAVQLTALDPDTYETFNFSYSVIFGGSIDSNLTRIAPNKVNFTWNTTGLKQLPNSMVVTDPVYDKSLYKVNINVTDSQNLTAETNISLILNRGPAENIKNGAYLDNTTWFDSRYIDIKKTVYVFNGSYIFYVNTSDHDLLRSCNIDFGDNTINPIHSCEADVVNGPTHFSSSNVNHRYNSFTGSSYNVSFNATDWLGAISTVTLAVNYNDVSAPIAAITSPPDGSSVGSTVTMEYNSQDHIAYCGYFVDSNISNYEPYVLLNLPAGGLTYLASCSGITQVAGPLTNITFFAVDSMGRADYDMVKLTAAQAGDTTPPVLVSIDSPAAGTLTEPSVPAAITIQIQASDADSGLENIAYTIYDSSDTPVATNSKDYASKVNPRQWTDSAEIPAFGAYYIIVALTDFAGNQYVSDARYFNVVQG